MPVKKPPSWEREFDPQRDLPPPAGRHELLTADVQSLATGTLPKPPVGEFLFTMTRKVELTGHVETASGRTGDWVYHVRGDNVFVRAYTPARDPRSTYQVEQRMRLKTAHIGWWEHTQEQREGWDAFAAQIPHLKWDKGVRALSRGRRANRLYISAQLNRLAMGLPVRNDPPTAKCDVQISDVELVPAPQAGQLALRLFHHGRVQPGTRLLIEMTPAMKTQKRKPQARELTRAATTDLGSFFPLGENGAIYLLEQPRYAVASGQRFGLRVTLITEDGLRSRSRFYEELRWLEPQPAGVAESYRSYRSYKTYTSSATAETSKPDYDEVNRRHKEWSERRKAPRVESAAWLAESEARDTAYQQQLCDQDAARQESQRQREEEWRQYKLQWERDNPGERERIKALIEKQRQQEYYYADS